MIGKELVGEGKIDYVLMSFYLSLVAIGWMMIYAVGYKQGYDTMEYSEFMFKTSVGKQTIFIGVAIFLSLIIFSIDAKFWRVFAYPLYAVGTVLLMLVLVFGREINGAKAWFSIGGFGFQPAEIAKLGTALALSSYLSAPSINLKDSRTQMTVFGLLAIPIFFIMLQPDAGSMLIFISFSIMLYREGLSPLPYIVGISLITIFILALVVESNQLVMYLMMFVSILFTFNISDKQRLWYAGVITLILLSAICFFTGKPQWAITIMLLTVLTFVIVHSRRGRLRW